MNALIIAYKPPFITSNAFLSRIKKRYNIAKAGFSGTLDPFAQGTLLIACGSYTRLLPFINTSPKTYIATLWLGATSKSLDIENISRIDSTPPINEQTIYNTLQRLIGEITYTPPIFSAKKINGTRAYTLARSGKEISLKSTTMQIYSLKLLCYNHPFITFITSVSRGSYIRSLGSLIAKELNLNAALCSLNRISEGNLAASIHSNLQFISPLDALDLPHLELPNDKIAYYENAFSCGLKLNLKHLNTTPPSQSTHTSSQKNTYIVKFPNFFSIIRILDDGYITYLCNRIPYAHTL